MTSFENRRQLRCVSMREVRERRNRIEGLTLRSNKVVKRPPKKGPVQCPLEYGRRPNITTAGNLGMLDMLPTELQQEILEHLHISSLLAFRRVNQKAEDAVDGMVKWKKLSKMFAGVAL